MSGLWSRLRVPALIALVVGGAVFAAACGGGEEEESSSGSNGAAKATSAAGGGSEGGDVNVELNEWSVKPASSSTSAGSVEFKVSNKGTTPHELLVLKADVAADKLEKSAAGTVDETKYQVIGRTKQLNAGQSEDLTANLTAGKYVLLCNISGHYDLGMRAAFTVN